MLRDIEAGDGPSGLKEATPAPSRQPIVFAVDGTEYAADLYLPGEASRAAIVLVPGLTPRGRDDERLVAFASTLARARFDVLVPDLPRMRALQVTAADAEPIAAGAHWLDERHPSRPLGVAAVSFAVGPAIIALDGTDASRRVDFFLGIGGYYDLRALITYVTTGFYREDGAADWRYRPPKKYGRWVFLLSNAGRIDDLDDRATLLEIASRRLDDPEAPIDDLAATLGPDGTAVYALIINADPERVPALIEALPPEVRTEMDRLDLSRRPLEAVVREAVLIHDRNDRIIPAAESVALARALEPADVHLYVVEGLDHAQVERLGPGDTLDLLDAVYTVLRLRDGALPPA